MSDTATLLDLDAKHALESVVREQRVAARAEANRLAAIVAFCDCHPVVDDRGPDEGIGRGHVSGLW